MAAMETDTDDEEVENVCQCSVCLDRYTDPRWLPCQHCFCMECLEDLLNARPRGGKVSFKHDVQIVCPNCRSICKFGNDKTLSSLPKNLVIAQVVDLLNKRSPKVEERGINELSEECSFCQIKAVTIARPGTATSSEIAFLRCTTCRKFYCRTCFRQNHKVENDGFGSPTKHDIMVWKRTEKERKSCFCCEEHKFVLKYFCNDCKKVCCVDCCLNHHRQHELKTVDFAAYAVRENLKPSIEKAKKKIEAIEKLKDNHRNTLSSVRNLNQRTVKTAVVERKEKILEYVASILDKAQENLIDTWNEQRGIMISEIDKEIGKLEMAEATACSILDLVSNDRIKDDINLLTEFEMESVKTQLENIFVPSTESFYLDSLQFCFPEIYLDEQSNEDLKCALGKIRKKQETDNYDEGNTVFLIWAKIYRDCPNFDRFNNIPKM